MALLDKINSKLGKPAANPIERIIETPKFQAAGKPVASAGDKPIEDDELPEEQAADILTKSEEEIKKELGIERDEGRPLGVTPDKKLDFSKQADKIISVADKLQTLVFGIIADIEDVDGFKFTDREKEEFMLFLPDVAEEHGIAVNDTLFLALAFIYAMISRARQAMRLRKADPALQAREDMQPKKTELHVVE
jgi:hypothetical protein